jgi:hypothetical protein
MSRHTYSYIHTYIHTFTYIFIYIEEAGPFETEKNKSGLVRKISVFERTIDRMWLLAVIINPTIAVATLGEYI